MNNDKYFYNFMIKNHPTIVGWLIHKGVLGKNDNSLYIKEENKDEKNVSFGLPNEDYYHVYETYEDGVRRIEAKKWDETFSPIRLNYKNKGYSFKPLVDAGFPIFAIGEGIERYCFTHQIEDIINNFNDLVLDVYFPKNYKRMKGKSIVNFMKFIQNQVDYVTRDNSSLNGNYSFKYAFIGQRIGNNDNVLEKLANIDRHGIFANAYIYRHLEWNFDLVEQYKDQIIWKELINESNLIWPEEMLSRYERYIPFCNIEADTYCGKFKEKIDYTKFGFLGNSFLDSHKDVLDWIAIFKECKFEWTAKDMSYFSEYAFSIDLPYSDSFRTSPATSDIKYSQSRLLFNNNFNWTPDNLLAYLLSNRDNWKMLVKDFRPELFKTFLLIPNIKEIAEPYVKNIKNFWDIVSNPHPYPYDELTPEFTIERIQNNIEEWSKVINNKYISMRRTPDTNYYYYRAINQWDVFRDRNNIPLTYELAKYLSTIDIKIGGTYMESDGDYMEKDNRFPSFNGLEAFSSHHIYSIQDVEVILDDERIASILLDFTHSVNLDLLYYVLRKFFKDYPIIEYINVINQLKDWDVVKVFYGDEETHNSYSDKDWEMLLNDIKIN